MKNEIMWERLAATHGKKCPIQHKQGRHFAKLRVALYIYIYLFIHLLWTGLSTSLRNRWTLSPGKKKHTQYKSSPLLTSPLSGYVIRLLSESDPVVMEEIKVLGKGKVNFNTLCLSKAWYFKAWEIIAMTQFSDAKAGQHYFNRLSHLFILLFHPNSNCVSSHCKYTR